jgi:hypothetical protein
MSCAPMGIRCASSVSPSSGLHHEYFLESVAARDYCGKADLQQGLTVLQPSHSSGQAGTLAHINASNISPRTSAFPDSPPLQWHQAFPRSPWSRPYPRLAAMPRASCHSIRPKWQSSPNTKTPGPQSSGGFGEWPLRHVQGIQRKRHLGSAERAINRNVRPRQRGIRRVPAFASPSPSHTGTAVEPSVKAPP